MATLKAVILDHAVKKDGTYNVKIRLIHNRVNKYISTSIFVVKAQLNKHFEIKDQEVNEILNDILKEYRLKISRLGLKVGAMSAEQIKNHLVESFQDQDVDFVKFSREYIAQLQKEGRGPTSKNHVTVLNSVIDFFRTDTIPIGEINYSFLIKWERYLKSERKITRKGNKDQEIVYVVKPVSDAGLHGYMRDLRTMFKMAMLRYNDEDAGVIKIAHYPFAKYKVASPPETKKRNIPAEQIIDIINYDVSDKSPRVQLAKDVFVLSFYLIGMNTVDLYQIDEYSNGRLSYNRSKTKGKRKDNAFISIKVEPEATDIISRYLTTDKDFVFDFKKRYASSISFNKNVNKGLAIIAEDLKIEALTVYYARHTWATIARNKCGIDKDIIQAALNHVDTNKKVTDIYIEKDWSIIDRANRKVLDYIKK